MPDKPPDKQVTLQSRGTARVNSTSVLRQAAYVFDDLQDRLAEGRADYLHRPYVQFRSRVGLLYNKIHNDTPYLSKMQN